MSRKIFTVVLVIFGFCIGQQLSAADVSPSWLAWCCLQATACGCEVVACSCDASAWCAHKTANSAPTVEHTLACGCCILECFTCMAFFLKKAPIDGVIGPCCCCLFLEIDATMCHGKYFRGCAGCAGQCAVRVAAGGRACAQRLRGPMQVPDSGLMK